MTVSIKDIAVLESPKTLVIGESVAYAFDFSDVGTPSAYNATLLYDDDGTDRSAYLSGGGSLAGDIVTSDKFTPPASSAGMYRLLVSVTISGLTKYGMVFVAVTDKVYTKTALASTYYGTVDGVAVFVPKVANKAGKFDDTTRPPYNSVVTLIQQVNSILNAQLAQNGFTVPVTDTDITPMLAIFVNEEVASIIEGINGSGRFSPRSKTGGGSRFRLITEDVAKFLEDNAVGMSEMGAARPEGLGAGIGYRSTDEAGDETFPLFQRKGFGDDAYQINWDED